MEREGRFMELNYKNVNGYLLPELGYKSGEQMLHIGKYCGEGTLVKSGQPDEGCLQSPGTAHCGTKGVPFCAEAWDAVARYIYTGLQGGSTMRGWMKEENTMIACCNDGTRPVIFKIERIDCE